MVASDIVKVSVPLVAGMAASAIVCEASGPIGKAVLAGTSLAACAALIFLSVLTDRRSSPALVLLYFLLGIFCYSSRSLLPPRPPFRPFGIGWLTSLIDGTPFGSESTGALAKALLTGIRDGLPKSTVSAFRASGASHILALSGLHLGVIYAAIGKLLSLLGRSRRAVALRSGAIILLCGLYTSMTGAAPSIVRAFLFILIRECARLLRSRSISSLSVYALALTIQTVLDPLVITSVGFQLSYLAMLGIFTVFPVLESWYPSTIRSEKFDPIRRVWVSASLAISCQLFTGPLSYLHFGTFPKYFLLTNLLALPLTEGFIVCALGAIALYAVIPGSRVAGALIEAGDFLATLMLESLRVISKM